MTTTAEVHKVNGDNVAQGLEDVCAKLTASDGEVVLDFSGVQRIDPSGLRAIEDLADAADGKLVKVTVQGVNVDVYKVLKLARLSQRFSIVN
jgi:anti-anti-sigma regulatory factor